MSPNNLGKKYLVEQCQKISISKYLRRAKRELKKQLISSQLELEGLNIDLVYSHTGYKGVRYWFACPLCGRRSGVLFRHPANNTLGCRICLNLVYRSNRYEKMAETNLDKT